MYECINKCVISKGAPKANLSLLLYCLHFTHESSGFLESLYCHPLALDLPNGHVRQELTADRRPYLIFCLSLLTKHSWRDEDPPDRTSYCRSHINWIINPAKPCGCYVRYCTCILPTVTSRKYFQAQCTYYPGNKNHYLCIQTKLSIFVLFGYKLIYYVLHHHKPSANVCFCPSPALYLCIPWHIPFAFSV
jgi:hypothetical protein